MTTITLVRHGHIINPDDVFHGRRPGFALSDQGRAQILAAADWLRGRGVTAVYTSPMLRARQSAMLLGQALQLPQPYHIDERLNEIYSPFDGHSAADMRARQWDFYTGVTAPYEQPEDILRRVQQLFGDLRRRHFGQHVLGVSHADPIAFALLWALGQPPNVANRHRLREYGLADAYPATASMSQFQFEENEPEALPEVRYFRPYP